MARHGKSGARNQKPETRNQKLLVRRLIILLRRELSLLFFSPIAYVTLFFFLILNGLSFWFAIVSLNHAPAENTIGQVFFNTVLFWMAYLLVFPLITMRSFAEEFKLGTIETLMTAPVRDEEVVLSKFFAAFLFYLSLWLPSLLYFLVFSWLGNRGALGSTGQIWAPYLLLFATGAFNVALGCLASALTSNQIVAAMISFVLTTGFFFLTLAHYLANRASPLWREIAASISQVDHMESFSSGIIDSRALVFYPSMALLFIFITFHVFQWRRWRA
jgi:ABC-2 type transport system permease protein